jgi:integrase
MSRDDAAELRRVAALTGLRPSELVGLEGEHLDFTRGRLTVAETLVEMKRHLISKEPETVASRMGSVADGGERSSPQEDVH